MLHTMAAFADILMTAPPDIGSTLPVTTTCQVIVYYAFQEHRRMCDIFSLGEVLTSMNAAAANVLICYVLQPPP